MLQNNKEIRTVFMGTSELSEAVLQSLIDAKYNIVGVFTKPDMKVGRKQVITQSAVKILAQKNNLDVYQPARFKTQGVEILQKLNPDLIVVAAYGKILPKTALDIPKFGCINVHVSLLPKYRGASPVQNAILNGEKETGVTIMLMDEGIDTGDILAQKNVAIAENDTTETLMKKLAAKGAETLIETIPAWIDGKIEPKQQDHSLATHCQMIEREDGKISWTDTAQKIYDRYRAFTPWPGVFTSWQLGDEIIRLKLTSIEPHMADISEEHKVGEVFNVGGNIHIQTTEGTIIIKKIQKEGKSETDAKSFVNGYPHFVGSILI